MKNVLLIDDEFFFVKRFTAIFKILILNSRFAAKLIMVVTDCG